MLTAPLASNDDLGLGETCSVAVLEELLFPDLHTFTIARQRVPPSWGIALRTAHVWDFEGLAEGSDIVNDSEVAIEDGAWGDTGTCTVVNAMRDDVVSLACDVVIIFNMKAAGWAWNQVFFMPMFCLLYGVVIKLGGVTVTGEVHLDDSSGAGSVNVPLFDIGSRSAATFKGRRPR